MRVESREPRLGPSIAQGVKSSTGRSAEAPPGAEGREPGVETTRGRVPENAPSPGPDSDVIADSNQLRDRADFHLRHDPAAMHLIKRWPSWFKAGSQAHPTGSPPVRCARLPSCQGLESAKRRLVVRKSRLGGYCPVITMCPRRFHFQAFSSWPRTK